MWLSMCAFALCYQRRNKIGFSKANMNTYMRMIRQKRRRVRMFTLSRAIDVVVAAAAILVPSKKKKQE